SGMLGSADLVEAVAEGVARWRLPNYVLDPVMVATSGDRLLHRDAEQLIARRLVPLATLVTPNLDEAGILVGEPVRTLDAMERAGRALIELGAKAALVKGGHLPGDEVVDLLVVDGAVRRFARPRLAPTSGPSACASGVGESPAARFVMVENPRQCIPRARAAITSGTVDIPTASAPIRCSIRTSAGVS